MFVVGVTGGIGSGKTAVTDYFKQLGIDVVDADIASRTVVEPGTPALAAISQHFGDTILSADHSLDRAKLRQRIFSSPQDKQWLEQLLHPLIRDTISQQLAIAKSPYVVFVSPLLVESQQQSICDRLLVVDVPENTQLERTMQRDNNDEQQVRRIIASQASRQHRLEAADDIIDNSGDLAALHQKIKQLHTQYLQLAEKKQLTGNPQ